MNFEKIMYDVEDKMYELDSDCLNKSINEGISFSFSKTPYDEMLEIDLNLFFNDDSNLYQETLQKDIIDLINIRIQYLELLKKAFKETIVDISPEKQRLEYDIYSEDE